MIEPQTQAAASGNKQPPGTQVTTADAQPNKPPIVVLRERLIQRRTEIAAALTDIHPDQFIRAVMTSVALNPEILACTWQSLWLACMRACRDGLLPDGVEGAIVPYKGTATFIPMYQGLLRRFRRSGQFKWITANVVREGEEFSHFIDETGEHFRHVPGRNTFANKITEVYALATTLDGGVFVTVITIDEANKIKAMSKATRDDAPWKMWPEEMYRKTALRRLSKVLPSVRDIVPSFADEGPADEVAAILGGGAEALLEPPAAETDKPDTTADATAKQQQKPDDRAAAKS